MGEEITPRQLVEYLSTLSSRIMGAVKESFAASATSRLEGLRGTIEHIVYDAYEPTRYKRRADRPLITATEVNVIGGEAEVIQRLWDNPENISPTPQPKGGSSIHDVPWEIEEGRYPNPPGLPPRPAYRIYTDKITPEVLDEVGKAVKSRL